MSVIVLCRKVASAVVDDLTCAFSIQNWKDAGTRVVKTNRRKIVSNLILAAALVSAFYGALSPVVAMPLYDNMLFFPSKQFATDFDKLGGFDKEDASFVSASGAKLHAWYVPVPHSRGTVIISHGNAGNISYRVPLMEMFLKQNLAVLAFDYQGYGKSDGKPTIDHVCEDGLAAYDFLTRERGVEPSKIILYGESLGGGVASYIAANRKVAAIVLQSTFSSLPHIARSKMMLTKLYPNFLFPKNRLDSAKLMASAHAPLLIVHGNNDTIIPVAEAHELFKKATDPKKLVTIENANHNDMYGSKFESRLNAAVSNFLDTVL